MSIESQGHVVGPDPEDLGGAEQHAAPLLGSEPVLAPEPLDGSEPQVPERENFEAPGLSEERKQARAASALSRMLSTEPRPLDHDRFRVARLSTEEEDFIVVLRGLDQRELRDISRRAMRPSTKDEREQGAGPMLRDLDSSNMLTVATAMLDPDLSGRSAESQALLQKYGPGPEGVIKQWFAPGEITQMADRVMELSGWSDEALTRAKNS
jgi:hypothetical protein